MTKGEVLAMETGIELDNLVIQEIMHHIWDDGERPRCKICGVWKDFAELGYRLAIPQYFGCECGDYSTGISAAWQVVEKMRELDYMFSLANYDNYKLEYQAKFYNPASSHYAVGPAPEAICKAALLAKLEVSGVNTP